MTCAPLFFYFFLIVFFFRGESMTSKVHMTCRILFFPAKTSFCLDDSVGAFSPRGIQFLQVFRGSRVCCSLLQRPLPGVSCLDILWRLVKAFWIVSCAAACCISCSSRFRPCAGLSRLLAPCATDSCEYLHMFFRPRRSSWWPAWGS